MVKSGVLKRDNSGFSLLELVVSLIIISTLMLWAYKSLEGLAEDVERVSFEGVSQNIQAQVTLKVAYWFAEQNKVSKTELRTANPMELIQHRPFNYAGEITYNELAKVQGEFWYFVTDKRWLVYKAKRVAQLKNEFEQVDVIPFQVVVTLQQPDREKGLAVEASLLPLYKFYWKAD